MKPDGATQDDVGAAGRARARRAWGSALLWTAILALAIGLRLPTLRAAAPYLNYIDEGHVLRPASRLLGSGGWDPGWYSYPSLPIYAVTAGGYLYAPVYNALHGHSLRVELNLLLAQRTWQVRMRTAVLAAVAAVVASVVTMPALLLKPNAVVAAWRAELGAYASKIQGSFWGQAISRAEWDLPLDHPEVGLVFVILAVAGLLVVLADPRLSRRVWSWVAYGIVLLLVTSRVSFRPFRNLLPLAAIGCVLVGTLIARLRARASRPILVDLGALAVVAVSMAVPSIDYARTLWHYPDSRAEAVDWLVKATSDGDTVLLVEEMVFLPGDLARLQAETVVLPWADVQAYLREQTPDYVVAGELRSDSEPLVALHTAPELAQEYEMRATFGTGPTPAGKPNRWRGNRQLVVVMARPGAQQDDDLASLVDFADIADASWTDESYRHVAAGEQTSVQLQLKADAPRAVRLRHFDHAAKDFEVLVDGQPVGSLVGGEQGGGWQMWQAPVPKKAGDEVLVTVRATGSDALGLSWVELGYTSAAD